MLTIKLSKLEKRTALALTMLVSIFAVLMWVQDFLRSELKNLAFYFSESFIFSSFWWLFAPLLFAQYYAVKHKVKKQFGFRIALFILPIILHLIAFPLFVWGLSTVFYHHSYTFQQTLRYTLAEHLYLLALIYSIPILIFQYFSKKQTREETVAEIQNKNLINQFITNILVTDGYKKYNIPVSDIFYFSADTPYISLHLEGKKYLHHETLKSISLQLNPAYFVRVHKSTVVNIKLVTSYTTRLNGDYDLTMRNNVQLRVSRNFATEFKERFKLNGLENLRGLKWNSVSETL